MSQPHERRSFPERLNLAVWALDARVAEGCGDRVAVRTTSGESTFDDVRRLSNQYGQVLRQLGVRREERVVVALPDGVDFVGAFFGTLKLGAVVVMANPGLGHEQLHALLDYVEPIAIVTTSEVGAKVASHRRTDGERLRVLVADDVSSDLPSFRSLAPSCSDELESVATHRDDPAIWLFSGGTTGLPKGVVQSHRSFVNTTELYARRALGLAADDVTISVPKLFFGYATGSNLIFPFSVGASCVLFPEHPTPEILFDLVERFEPTVLVNVPTMINRMLEAPDAERRDLSSLRFTTSAGEALPVPLYHRWREVFGSELLDGLGTAEMWHIFVSNVPGAVRPGTLGRAVPGFDVRVRDDSGSDLPAGEIGRLWVRGDSRAIGYWRHAEKSEDAFRGEWFVGGDLVSMDADGFVTYCGRGDDVMKVAGRWLAPQEVESCLKRHEAVDECAVVGIPNDEGLLKPVAYVVGKGDATDGLEQELKEHCLRHLDRYKHPREVVLVPDLPRTHLGKIDRGRLKRRDL